MESLAAVKFDSTRFAPSGSMIAPAIATIQMTAPAITESGRISLPGFPSGLSVEAYLSLSHLYTNVIEASRILDRYRSRLRLLEAPDLQEASVGQAPLTALTASNVQPHLYYKREDQTVTKAYKVRGAVVGMAKLMEAHGAERFLAVSTGNHALGLFKAAELLGPKAVRVVVPHNTALCKLEKLNAALESLKKNQPYTQADLLQVGQTFDEAREWAHANRRSDESILDPYGDPWVVAGQGTIGLELLQQLRPLLQAHKYEEVCISSPVGGGGLLTGTATALRMAAAWDPAFQNVNLRFLGWQLADMHAALGDAIRVHKLADFNQTALGDLSVRMGQMTNDQMAQGQAYVKRDLGKTVEGPSGGAVSAAMALPGVSPGEKRLLVGVLSGANVSR
jgi:threonine synthase